MRSRSTTTERLPDLLDSAEALEANRASTEASIRDFAEVLRSGADPVKAVKLGSATVAYALDGAQHGVPLTTLTRSYRLGHAATSQHLKAILAQHVADADELNVATDLCSAWMFAYVDTALCLVEDVYITERERWLRSAAASQAETISTILSGQPIDVDVASRRLRHDLRRVHVAAVAWLDTHEEGRNTLALLEAAIRDIAAAIGNQRPLVQPLGTLSVAAWISTSSEVPSRVLDELRFRTATAPGVRVAIGEPARGIGGISRQPCRGARSAADRAIGGPPRGQRHPLQRHRPALARHRGTSTRPAPSSHASWAHWRLPMTPPADSPRRCAPISTRTAAAAEPPNDSASTRTPSPTGSGKPRNCWDGQWTSAPSSCGSHSPWPNSSTRRLTRRRASRPRRGQRLQGLRSGVFGGPAEEGLGLVGIHHD